MKRKLFRGLVSWLKYRRLRKEQARRAASLAVQLVLSGCLAPPRLAGAKGRIEGAAVSPRRFQAAVTGPGGVA